MSTMATLLIRRAQSRRLLQAKIIRKLTFSSARFLEKAGGVISGLDVASYLGGFVQFIHCIGVLTNQKTNPCRHDRLKFKKTLLIHCDLMLDILH